MMLDIQAIRALLTHRYPFLLVDRVTALEEKQSICGYKNVTVNEPFFNGHFPELPIMPGVLILEAMAQLCGVLGYQSLGTTGHNGDTIWVIAGIDGARFKKPVVPGDRLELSAVLANKNSPCGNLIVKPKWMAYLLQKRCSVLPSAQSMASRRE